MFAERITSGLWPACSPDLTLCDFYVWADLKDKVYITSQYQRRENGKYTKTDFEPSSGRIS
jgi:hypothetical protein